jgi:hypothetical protein
MKPPEIENDSAPTRQLWRMVRKSRWINKSTDSLDHVKDAAQDFKLRAGEEYLSFFLISNEEEGREVAAALKAVQPVRCDSVDFMLFPQEFLTDAGISLVPKPCDDLPEILRSRHLGTAGPVHEPDELFIKRLLILDSVKIIRMKKLEIVVVAKRIVDKYPDFPNHLEDFWRPEVMREYEL